MASEERIPNRQEGKYETREIVANALAHDILGRKRARPQPAPYLVGIEGSMASGKGKLTQSIAAALEMQGIQVQIVSADHYMNPGHIRKGGSDPARQYSEATINIAALESQVLARIKDDGALREDVALYDVKEESKPEGERKPLQLRYDIDKETIVLVEGIFTLKDQIKPYFDTSIFLDVDEEEVRKSAAHRNRPGQDKPIKTAEELERGLSTRQIPGYNIFKAEDEPQNADYVVERKGDGWRIAARRAYNA